MSHLVYFFKFLPHTHTRAKDQMIGVSDHQLEKGKNDGENNWHGVYIIRRNKNFCTHTYTRKDTKKREKEEKNG